MPSYQDYTEAPRRELHVFYVLDTSGSMTGVPIATLNRAMEETAEVLRQEAKSNADAIVKIAVLEFNSGCRWLQPSGPEELTDFIWEDLEAGGLTDIGSALDELDSKLSREAFLKSATGAYLPVIIFMTDGYATDDYGKALNKIRQNKWFARGTKIGFAVGDDADMAMISNIVGNCEAVVKTDDLQLFARLLKFVSRTASMVCSRSQTTDEAVTGKDIVQQVIDNGLAPDDIVVADVSYDPEPPVTDDGFDDIWDDNDWL